MLNPWESLEGEAVAATGRRTMLVRPSGVTRGRWEMALAAACVAAALGVVAAEAAIPSLVSLGSLVFLPVLCAAWWLGDAAFVAVTVVAIGARLFGIVTGGVDAGTAAAEATVILAIAAAVRLLRSGIERLRETEAGLSRQATRARIIGERDRIGEELNRSTVSRLFALTLQLQAIASRVDDPRARAKLGEAIHELDELCTDVRELVFSDQAGA